MTVDFLVVQVQVYLTHLVSLPPPRVPLSPQQQQQHQPHHQYET